MKPFKLSEDFQIIILPVRIEGPSHTRYLRMILDTGATYTMVCPDVLIECGYDLSTPTKKVAITTASSVEYAPFFKINSIEALGHTVANIEVASHTLPPRVPAEGLLGLNFLREFRNDLDFPNLEIKLVAKGQS
jgi:predicted aspartyl protease